MKTWQAYRWTHGEGCCGLQMLWRLLSCFHSNIQLCHWLLLLWSHVNDLGYEGKVAMVSWMEATESDIFKAEEILMARHTTLVLQKKSDQHIRRWLWNLPLVWTCPPSWCPDPQSQGYKLFFGQNQHDHPSCSQPKEHSYLRVDFINIAKGTTDPRVEFYLPK